MNISEEVQAKRQRLLFVNLQVGMIILVLLLGVDLLLGGLAEYLFGEQYILIGIVVGAFIMIAYVRYAIRYEKRVLRGDFD